MVNWSYNWFSIIYANFILGRFDPSIKVLAWYTLIFIILHVVATKMHVVVRTYVVLTWMHDRRELV